MINLSLCIPTYNSSQYVEECLKYTINSDIFNEVLISDDCSTTNHYNKLNEIKNKYPKIKLIKTPKNIGGFKNKYYSVENCNNDWIYLLDSDNHMTKDTIEYIKTIENLDPNICYCPQKLILHHNNEPAHQEVMYDFGYEYIGLNEVKSLLNKNVKYSDWFLNTGNFIFNRDTYLNFLYEKYNEEDDTFAGDVISMSYYWLKNGGKFKIVKGFEYYHRLRSDSYWISCGSNSSSSVNKYTSLILSL